jgi:hypothetical protein
VDLTRRVSVIQARDRTLTPAAGAFRDLMRRTAKGFNQAD